MNETPDSVIKIILKIVIFLIVLITVIYTVFLLKKDLLNTSNNDQGTKQTVESKSVWFSFGTPSPLSKYCLQEGESAQIKTEIKNTYYIKGIDDQHEKRDYWTNYVSISKNGEEIRRFPLDESHDAQEYSYEPLLTPCYLYTGIQLVSLSENKLTIEKPGELRQYNYNGEFKIISKGDFYNISTSQSGRYIGYEDVNLDDKSKSKFGIFDSQENITHELFLENEIFKHPEIDNTEDVSFIWPKNEEKVWIKLENTVGNIIGFISIDLNIFSEPTFYDLSDTKWSRVFSFNPDTGWFVSEDGGTASGCFSEGSMSFDSIWYKYFINIYTGEKQFIESNQGCPVYKEAKWIDDTSYQETLIDGNIKTFTLKTL